MTTTSIIQPSQGNSEEVVPTSVQPECVLLLVESYIVLDVLNDDITPTTNTIITNYSMGDSEEVAPTSVQPN